MYVSFGGGDLIWPGVLPWRTEPHFDENYTDFEDFGLAEKAFRAALESVTAVADGGCSEGMLVEACLFFDGETFELRENCGMPEVSLLVLEVLRIAQKEVESESVGNALMICARHAKDLSIDLPMSADSTGGPEASDLPIPSAYPPNG